MFEKIKAYLAGGQELNIILFKILGIGGICISIVSGIFCLGVYDYSSAVINGVAAVLAVLLMIYVEKSGRYVFGYMVVDIGVFMFLFAMLFFTGGGMNGSMPYFFSFALMFTFLMFEGKLLAVMESLLAAFYFGIMLFSVFYPQYVQDAGDGMAMVRERMLGVFIPSITMGLIFLHYIREYTKQKQIADEANRAKSVFLANMSHEIRTPVNAVLGFNEIILRTTGDQTVKEYAGYIDQSGHRLLSVINEILDFSRIESGKEQQSMETFSLKELAEEMHSLMSILDKDRALKYELDYDETLSEMVVGDREKLVRVLTNLISNAFKYTREGSVILSIGFKEMTEDGQKILFAVKDTGIGIRMSDIDKLFRAYERADLMKNSGIEGTGLGLAITEQLLHLMGSSVHVESTYGKGSTFSFELTLASAGDAVTLKKEEQSSSFMMPEAKLLVVDDDEMNRRLMDSFLGTLGINADLADSAEACLELVKTRDYHLILMDYMMPGMDGAEAMEKIRADENTNGRHTPIVVLTADVVDNIDRKLIARGFDDYLSKPIGFAQLEQALLKFVPGDLVIYGDTSNPVSVTGEQYESAAKLLEEYGISLENGLELVNGDFAQYLRIADFFASGAGTDIGKVRTALEREDMETLRLAMHSLKAKAGSVGAGELQSMAREMESRCRADDREYVHCGMELVLLLWNRCAEGLKKFTETQDKARSDEADTEPGSFDDLLEELLRSLDLCEGRRARNVLEQMKKTPEGNECSRALEDTERLLDEMEFEAAAKAAGSLRKE